jgi:RNA polymerase sigma factor (TIGR02999 family)
LDRVYAQLRAIANVQMNGERAGHTLQATALVHEAYARLAEAGVQWSGPAAFYHAAAEAMRRILIDHARARRTVKRGGGRHSLELDGVLDLASADDPRQVMALDGAISRLEQEDARAAEVVRLRFYAGLTVDQTAAALGQSRRTVLRDWEFARAWLVDDLDHTAGGAGE